MHLDCFEKFDDFIIVYFKDCINIWARIKATISPDMIDYQFEFKTKNQNNQRPKIQNTPICEIIRHL